MNLNTIPKIINAIPDHLRKVSHLGKRPRNAKMEVFARKIPAKMAIQSSSNDLLSSSFFPERLKIKRYSSDKNQTAQAEK